MSETITLQPMPGNEPTDDQVEATFVEMTSGFDASQETAEHMRAISMRSAAQNGGFLLSTFPTQDIPGRFLG